MLGSSMNMGSPNTLGSSAAMDVLDDILLTLGSDGDDVLVHRTGALNANTALTSVVVGTPVTLATAADSLIISNVTSNGDIHLMYSVGGNSKTALLLDGSAHTAYFTGVISLGSDIIANGNSFRTASSNNVTAIFKAYDNDTGSVEIGRLQAAADPYFGIGSASGHVGIRTITVTIDHASHGALNAADVTDNALVWQQPAGSVLLGVKVVLTEQFVAPSLTDIDFTLGQSGGDEDGWLVIAMNGVSDAVATAYKTRGALWDTSAEGVFWYASAANDIYIFVTATGANLNTLTAGTWTAYFTYLDIP